jgi:hypothetical protein
MVEVEEYLIELVAGSVESAHVHAVLANHIRARNDNG